MPKLNSLPTDYYSLQGGVGYNAILDHFKQQAEGQQQQRGIMPTSGGNGRNQNGKSKGSRLRLVKIASKADARDTPKVDVVDPNEAVKNRATAELKRKLSSNMAAPATNSQSRSRRGRGKNSQSSTTAAASKAIKRARDVFDQ